MQALRLKHLIIGLAAILGLTVQANNVHALYSPRIAQQVAIIQQHVLSSQAQHGDGSVLDAIESVKAYDKARRNSYEATGVPGEARIAQELVLNNALDFFDVAPLDGISMVFNLEGTTGTFISNCLRDDIWNLELLRDLVAAEMIKAYLSRDVFHGALLKEDYVYLNDHISLLREHGWDPSSLIPVRNENGETEEIPSHVYFFGGEPIQKNGLNHYSTVGVFDSSDPSGCPDGEFEEAIQEVVNAWKTLEVLGSGQNVEWGSIWQMAQANARIRARQWIRANQISLTIGGEEGARIQSLVKGGGWDRFVGNIKTQGKIIKNMVGPVTPLWSFAKWAGGSIGYGIAGECAIYDVKTRKFNKCNDNQVEQYKKCKKNPDLAVKDDGTAIRCDRFKSTKERLSIVEKASLQRDAFEENRETKQEAERTLVYHITLDSVAENTIYDLDEILWDMNMIIQTGYEGTNKQAGAGIPTLTNELGALTKRQCANKQ